MNKYILYAKSASLTGKRLAKELGIKGTRFHKRLKNNDEIVLRYGHRYGFFNTDTEINSKRTIELCADSLYFLTFCRDAGFYVPEYFSPKEVDDVRFPLYLRERKHFGGKDIKIINNEKEYEEFIEPSHYIVFPSKIQYEIRIHVVDNEVVRIFKKVGESNSDFPVRTAHNGWKYSLVNEPWGERYAKARELALNLSDAINLNFGAFDMGFDEDRREYITFEINTAPSLVNNPNTMFYYLKYFKQVLENV